MKSAQTRYHKSSPTDLNADVKTICMRNNVRILGISKIGMKRWWKKCTHTIDWLNGIFFEVLKMRISVSKVLIQIISVLIEIERKAENVK